ncbi:FAS1 domain-containing protein [Radiomyces spectabilis]|uniref:FAS1 domain-containing protein n=1 Tax=Radiomyces spectabilis TaxID=64574 RepID=UPI0022206C22|nr:FAS1 domain-containing protein [Radiomyces spectabilis]KAI8377519.1 FAS1 domain-containing protein [Radiomyces spectabilis]
MLVTPCIFILLLSCASAYKTIIDVLSEDARFSTLIYHIQRQRLVPYINRLPRGTLFAPDNDAFARCDRKDITKTMLLYHLLPDPMRIDEFHHDQILESLYVRPGFLGSGDPGQHLKVQQHGNTIWINQAKIISKDIPVNRQTYIHVVNRVLEPPPSIETILRRINKDIYQWMDKISMSSLLSQPRPFTIFFSRQSFFTKFNSVEASYLSSSYGQKDLFQVLSFAVVEDVIYANNISSAETHYKTLSGEPLSIKRSGETIAVNEVAMVQHDLLAENGVIHVLDQPLIPDSLTFNVRKYLYGLNATKFVSMMDAHHLSDYLTNDDEWYTFLVPPNHVIDEDDIPENAKTYWLQYHLAAGQWTTEYLRNGMLLKTEFQSDLLKGAPQRLPVHMTDHPSGLSLSFGQSSVMNDPIMLGKNVIYRIAAPLTMPYDLFSSLVVDLNLSTFIATLYVSGVVDKLKDAQGITLFAPTNDAFDQLGLVAKYLLHPSGRTDLQHVLQFHAAKELQYSQDMKEYVIDVPTFASDSLHIVGYEDGRIAIGSNRQQMGKVIEKDILVKNGVVHKIDQVQIPLSQVQITHHHLLLGAGANIMQEVLKQTGLIEVLGPDIVLLAPTDKAFASMDLDVLFNDSEQLERVAKMHIVNSRDVDRQLENKKGVEYATRLSEYDKVIIRNAGHGELMVEVKGNPTGHHARVIGRGTISGNKRFLKGDYGPLAGGVLEIDTVLTPIRRGLFGLPWGWSLTIISAAAILFAGALGATGYLIYNWWKRWHGGYETIPDSENTPDNTE